MNDVFLVFLLHDFGVFEKQVVLKQASKSPFNNYTAIQLFSSSFSLNVYGLDFFVRGVLGPM